MTVPVAAQLPHRLERYPSPMADARSAAISPVLRHELLLVMLTREEFQGQFIDRTIPVTIPREAADQDWHWRVVIL